MNNAMPFIEMSQRSICHMLFWMLRLPLLLSDIIMNTMSYGNNLSTFPRGQFYTQTPWMKVRQRQRSIQYTSLDKLIHFN